MRNLAWAALIGGVALAIIAVAVFGAGDTRLFVPAPEAEVENFMRPLLAERHAIARAHLSAPLHARTSVRDLRDRRNRLVERWGAIEQISGEPGDDDGRHARATAVLRTRGRRDVRLRLALSRESGVWRISAFGDLTR